MNNFNTNFYQPNFSSTVEDAAARLKKLGYKNFTFKSCSRANGASFYFLSEEGKELRVSDHKLTGKRAFDTVEIPLYESKVSESPIQLRNRYTSGEISKKEYKQICKKRGFIFKP